MNETILLALVCASGVLFGMAVASRRDLSRLAKRQGKLEVNAAKLAVGLSADVWGLKARVGALEGGDAPKPSRPAPPPPPPRPTDSLRRQPDVANDGEEVPKVEGDEAAPEWRFMPELKREGTEWSRD